MRVDPGKTDKEKLRQLDMKLQGYKRIAAITLVCLVVYFFFIKLVFL